ncbi:MAG TPA: cytochrome oxidase subunit III [Chitinophagaceae bacterium]|nr:cytochrome oxidase subunit III [Chitinophagaceae bacterium]HRF17532.1 cytochrome c oxidase subunit 3 [Chitinophagaceae bacterium]
MDIVSTQQRKKLHPHKFTLWVALGSIIMMFAGLTSAYIVKSNQTNWKPVSVPQIFWISTVVMVLSSLTLQMALRSFKQREMNKYRLLIGVTLLLGIAFVVCQWLGFQQLWRQQITFKGAGAGQFLYVIFGLHAIHVIGGVVVLLVMFIKAFLGRVKLYSAVPVEVAATYWHFVDLLWIYLLVFFLFIGSK